MYGDRVLKLGLSGPDVEELQIRLSGFSGSVPHGTFDIGTETQVKQFQTDFMKVTPTGIVDRVAFEAIDRFSGLLPIDFNKLKCPCGACSGFGQGLYKGQYVPGKPQIEAYHNYEYPGIHRVTLWSLRAIWFYYSQWEFIITSGYRCSVRNTQEGRTSTNHRGKAVDTDHLDSLEHKELDMERCAAIRASMVGVGGFQIGWAEKNKKSFEPSNIAPTWVHLDVRQFESKYLQDRFFCKDLGNLDNKQPITV